MYICEGGYWTALEHVLMVLIQRPFYAAATPPIHATGIKSILRKWQIMQHE